MLAGSDITAAALNALPAPLDTLAIGSVTNSAAETTIGTFANGIPANDPGLNSAYVFTVSGTCDVTATPTLRLRLYIASVTTAHRIFDSGVLTTSAGAGQPWWLWARVIITGTGSSGTHDPGGIGAFAAVSAAAITSIFTAQTINTTIANQILLTAQWGTASASNTCRSTGGTMGRL